MPTKVFAKRVWGFDPSRWPIVPFSLEGNRDRLLRESEPGDRVVLVGTLTEDTPEEMRGRLLGMAEISRVPVDTLEAIGGRARNERDFDERGRFRWPKAILMLRAWRFEPQPLLLDVLVAQLPYQATPMAVRLSEADAAAVLALHAVEVEVPATPALERLRVLDLALAASRPTKGPAPTSWSGQSARDADRAAHTYVFRFGSTDVWKVGHAIDLKERLKQVNCHVPTEVVPHAWRAQWTQRWETELAAYEMEQRVLGLLRARRTFGERVRCPEAELWTAWKAAIGIGGARSR